MIAPDKHIEEAARLNALDSYSILDSLQEEDYDNLTAIAAQICGTPISLVSLLDNNRQWFKSHHGLDVTETPKEYAFCAHAINHQDDIFVIQDSRIDERFKDNPLVTGDPKVIFYAGVPLSDSDGLPLGTLCVIDHKPRLMSQSQLASLKALSNQVMNLLRLRKKNILLNQAIEQLNEKNNELEQFAYVAAHDLKSPLNTISSTTELLSDCYAESLDDDGKTMLSFINTAANNLRRLIDGLLEYSKCQSLIQETNTNINLQDFRNNIYGLFSYDNLLSLTLKSDLTHIDLNRTVLDQIMINLVGNSIKYCDKELVHIEIGISEDDSHYEFYVQDNGPGIPMEHHDGVFEIFKIFANTDKNGQKGNGIGLATVRKLIEKMGGAITVHSDGSEGCRFNFYIEKSNIGSVMEESL